MLYAGERGGGLTTLTVCISALLCIQIRAYDADMFRSFDASSSDPSERDETR